ncbi:HYR domain-containing protein, partial [Marinifilum caeruleilacunae]
SKVVVWTYTDASGNSITQNQNIVIDDTTDPVADLATLADVNAQCEVTSLTAPTATDNCDGAITGTHTETFPITASKVVVWTYTDASGNSITQNQNIVIDDTTDPTITCPGNQNENYTASCNFTLPDYTGLATVNDNCDPAPVVSQSPAIGTVITANTTITLTVTDVSGNSSNCTFDVILSDIIAPVLSDLSDLNIIDCADDETIIPQVKVFAGLALPAARYSDNCSATFTVQYRIQLPDSSFANNYGSAATGASVSDPSGFEFPEGESTIFFRVLDASGNISNIESYTISVNHKPNPSAINF